MEWWSVGVLNKAIADLRRDWRLGGAEMVRFWFTSSCKRLSERGMRATGKIRGKEFFPGLRGSVFGMVIVHGPVVFGRGAMHRLLNMEDRSVFGGGVFRKLLDKSDERPI